MTTIPSHPHDVEGITCPACGGHNSADAVFCANPACGKALGRYRYVAEEFRARTHWHERIADRVAAFVGRSHFIVVHVGWFVVWVVVNTGLVALAHPFDQYPFGLLGLLLGAEAILLSGFLLISQNREREEERLRAELDYEVDERTHRQIEDIARMVRDISARLDRMEHGGAR